MCFFYILMAGCLFSLDQFIKHFVSGRFLPGEGVKILENVFHITLVHNTGIAFGLLRNKYNLSFMFFVLGLILCALILLHGKNHSRIGKISLSLIISGALSNLFDRLRLGYIIDYLDFRIWPVFNIADASITIGVFLVIWEIYKSKDANSKRYI